MKLLIDTNVSYHWSGLTKGIYSTSDFDALALKHKLYIASPSVIELCAHFKDDIEKIRGPLEKIRAEAILFIRDTRLPFEKDELDTILDAEEEDVQKLISELIERKVQAEAKQYSAYLLNVIVCIYSVLLNEAKKDHDGQSYQLLEKYSASAIYGNFPDKMRALFANRLRAGYRDGKPQQAGKASFEDNLELMMRIWALNDTASIKGIDPGVEFESSTSDFENHSLWNKLAKLTIDKPVSSIFNKGLTPSFESVISEVSSFISTDQGTDEPSLRFIDIIVKKVLVNHGKLAKNDLVDCMIFLGHFHVDRLLSEDGDYRDRVNSIIPDFAISISDAFLLS